MAITKPPSKATDAQIDDFINRAPDAAASVKVKPRKPLVEREKKIQITITLTPSLLMEIDRLAVDATRTRASYINQLFVKAVKQATLEGAAS